MGRSLKNPPEQKISKRRSAFSGSAWMPGTTEIRAVLSGKNLTFDDWADWFLENRSKPPFRAEKTHLQNFRIVELLRPTFGSQRLSDISSEEIEHYLRRRLSSGRRVPTKLGVQYRGTIKPMQSIRNSVFCGES
jgi:predicted membrane metal-binding protein